MILSNAAITAYAIRNGERGDGSAVYTAATLPGGVAVMVCAETPGTKTMARLTAIGVNADREIMVRSAVFDRMSVTPKAMDLMTLADLADNPTAALTLEIVEVRRSEVAAGRGGKGRLAVFKLVCKRAAALGPQEVA